MKKFNINKCTTAYEFDEMDGFLTYMYLIEKKDVYYVIDTYCGCDAMALVKEDMVNALKDVVVINTHAHWDHVWGNGAFEGVPVIGHKLTQIEMRSHYDTALERNAKYRMGNTDRVEPNITFQRQMTIDDLELIYSPGHTKDSITIYDKDTGLLIVGDNLELPLIYLESQEIDDYISSLELYNKLEVTYIAAGHNLEIKKTDLEEMIQYLYNVKEAKEISFADQQKQKVHESNMRLIHGR